ncbi:hypothetical protein ACLOJK_002899 [Asimina triloba]
MASRNSSISVEKQSSGITSVLASAAFEWLLIFLLFLEAFFSFLVTRFARFCELQTPCLLCPRLDHIFGIEKPGFYWDLICHEHKLEISSLVYCCTHGKLNDIRGMCKGCVSSFSAKKVADSETDKCAVGFIEYSVDDKHNICLKMPTAADGEELVGHSLLKDPSTGSSGLRQCSCCSQPLRTEVDDAQTSNKSAGTKSTGSIKFCGPWSASPSKKQNCHQSEERSNPSDEASELLSSNGISPAILELIVPEEPHSSSNAGKHPVEISEEMDVIKPVDTSTESDLKPEMILNEAVSSVSDCLDLNAAYKLAIANKGNHLLIMSKDIAEGHDDLKLLLSQISAARGFELSWNDVIPSPRVLQPVEGVLPIEASSSIESQLCC